MNHQQIVEQYGKRTWEALRLYVTEDIEYTDEQIASAAARAGVQVEQFKESIKLRTNEFISWDRLPEAARKLWIVYVTSDQVIHPVLRGTRDICDAARLYQSITS